jgi:hypothetical protein
MGARRDLLDADTAKSIVDGVRQFLGKFHFFKLFENLRRILVDYGEKRSSTANAAFNAAC